MLHGFRGAHCGFLKIAKKLGDNYNLIIPDLPGYGATQPFTDSRHDIETYASFLGDFIKALESQGQKVSHMLGYSLGATIASRYVAQNPNTIDKLIFICPIASRPIPKPLHHPLIAVAKTLYVMPERLSRPIVANDMIVGALNLITIKTKDPMLKRWIKAEHYRCYNSFIATKPMIETWIDCMLCHVGQLAPKVPNETLVIHGCCDSVGKSKYQRDLHKLLPNARSREVCGTGHLVPHEAPEVVVEEIKKFI